MECRWGVSQSGEIGEMGSTRPRSRGERWVRDDVRGTLGRDVIVTDQYTPRTTHDRFIHSSSACVIIRARGGHARLRAPRPPSSTYLDRPTASATTVRARGRAGPRRARRRPERRRPPIVEAPVELPRVYYSNFSRIIAWHFSRITTIAHSSTPHRSRVRC